MWSRRRRACSHRPGVVAIETPGLTRFFRRDTSVAGPRAGRPCCFDFRGGRDGIRADVDGPRPRGDPGQGRPQAACSQVRSRASHRSHPTNVAGLASRDGRERGSRARVLGRGRLRAAAARRAGWRAREPAGSGERAARRRRMPSRCLAGGQLMGRNRSVLIAGPWRPPRQRRVRLFLCATLRYTALHYATLSYPVLSPCHAAPRRGTQAN